MRHRLELLATAPRLLVASDFDGVLAPLVDRPDAARPLPEALEVLAGLAALDQTEVAIVSGRSVEQLRRFLADGRPLDPKILLAGGHGAEIAADGIEVAPPARRELLDQVEHALQELADPALGFDIERKTTGVALHYRRVDAALAERELPRILAAIEIPEGLRLREGKKILEFADASGDKGTAIERLRRLSGAAAVIFLGDDVTDEDGFAALGVRDLGVKIGEGVTRAEAQVEDLHEGIEALRMLLTLRRDFLATQRWTPIDGHALLSDQRSVALVSADGRITWMCVPRVDSPALFAELVGGPGAGSFEIYPLDEEAAPDPGPHPVPHRAPHQEWLGDSFILRTRWRTCTVLDYLDVSAGRAFQRAGRTDLLRVIEGRGRVRVVFAPRPDFGRASTSIAIRPEGLVIEGLAEPVALRSPGVEWRLEMHGRHSTAVAEIELGAEPVTLELRYGTGSLRPASLDEGARREQTRRAWSSWASSLVLPTRHPELVRRLALALRALCYGPSGAFVAAATTSLPEWPGGVRNWDYRFCWPRDAALAGASLATLGNVGMPTRLLELLLTIVDGCTGPERLRPLYTVTGGTLGAEGEISELSGWRLSAPVRVGNGASEQVQLDVFGPIVDLAWLLAERGVALGPDHWRLVDAMVTAVDRRWHEPDHGIWEIRAERRHHVYSKVMCWVAVDRAIRLAELLTDGPRSGWTELRDRIRDDVLEHGFSQGLGGFAAAYDQPEPDASALHVGLSGMLPPEDPRVRSTVELVQRRLRRGPTVYRYRFDDGLPGREGGFHICTSWLIRALWQVGRRDEAEALFDDLVALAGPTGLLSEQWDPVAGMALGNYPQAYSASAVIDAAAALDRPVA